jgi:hypothetical protein
LNPTALSLLLINIYRLRAGWMFASGGGLIRALGTLRIHETVEVDRDAARRRSSQLER